MLAKVANAKNRKITKLCNSNLISANY